MDKEMKRRCTWSNMDMLHSLVVLCLIYSACCTGLVNGLTITLNKNAVRNSDLKIFISTSSITSVIILTKPDTSSDNCAAPIIGPGLCSTPDLTQDFTTNVTTYSISSLVRSRDEGIWTAVHGLSDTNTIDIKVLNIPTLNVAQTVSALTLSSSNTQTLTISATCAYPAVLLDLYFVPTGGGTAVLSTSSTSSCTNSSSSCADTDAQDYTCDIVPKLGASDSPSAGTYNMLVVVNLAGQYEPIGLNATITDTVLTVIASSICDQCKTTTIRLGIVGLIFVLIAAVICWVLYCQLSGKCSGPLYERAKDGDIEFTTKKLFWSTVIATGLCLLGFFLCLPGVIICGMCEEGVTTSGKVTTALILVIIGFILALIIMIVEIILLVLVCCRKIKIKGETDSTGTNKVNSRDTNVTDDEKGVKKGETTDAKNTTDVKKRTDEVEMQGIDKTQKIDSV